MFPSHFTVECLMTSSSLIWMDYCSRSEISLFCFNKGLSQLAIIWRWSQSKAVIYILMHCIQELITHFTEREITHCRAQSFHVGQFPSNSHFQMVQMNSAPAEELEHYMAEYTAPWTLLHADDNTLPTVELILLNTLCRDSVLPISIKTFLLVMLQTRDSCITSFKGFTQSFRRKHTVFTTKHNFDITKQDDSDYIYTSAFLF